MNVFNSEAARRVIAGLSLSANQRRFTDLWLAKLGENGWSGTFGDDADEIMDNVVHFEVRPRQRVIWLGAGRTINEGLGADMAGRDYTALAGKDRAQRLARMTVVASGCISLHDRWVTNTSGRAHLLRELAVPCGPGGNGVPQTMTFVEIETGPSVGRVPPTGGVFGLAASFEAHPIT